MYWTTQHSHQSQDFSVLKFLRLDAYMFTHSCASSWGSFEMGKMLKTNSRGLKAFLLKHLEALVVKFGLPKS